jgi:hypothetical protein
MYALDGSVPVPSIQLIEYVYANINQFITPKAPSKTGPNGESIPCTDFMVDRKYYFLIDCLGKCTEKLFASTGTYSDRLHVLMAVKNDFGKLSVAVVENLIKAKLFPARDLGIVSPEQKLREFRQNIETPCHVYGLPKYFGLKSYEFNTALYDTYM